MAGFLKFELINEFYLLIFNFSNINPFKVGFVVAPTHILCVCEKMNSNIGTSVYGRPLDMAISQAM